MSSGEAEVAIRDLCVVRGGKTVLPRLSLTIRPRRVTGLLGASGAGRPR